MSPLARVLLAGVSTRAQAASAIRAGHSVAAVESFSDLDHPAAPNLISLEHDLRVRFSAARAAEAARSLEAPVACYAAGFENDGAAVAELARGRDLWGNPPAILARVRNPLLLRRALVAAGLPSPAARGSIPPPTGKCDWLLKPRRSGGGQRIRSWHREEPVPRWGYLQERISGQPGSLLFVADGRHAVPIALTRQLIGDQRFGASGYRYVGNLVGSAMTPLFPREAELLAAAVRIAEVVTRAFGLIGVNGVDFMARSGVPYPLEVNPRWTGAMEVAERAYGLPLFEWHRESCAGRLPAFLLSEARRRGQVEGKAIVFARRALVAGDTARLLGSDWVADLPRPGDRIKAGHPICTVFATGGDESATVRGLLAAQQRFLLRTRSLRERAA
ncbi:MAG: ATP-grasp domain-containing protein [Gemmatimonadota bacterium]